MIFRPVGIAAAILLVALSPAMAETGSASWYALDGNLTANGERMNSAKMTAAHRTLPFGTKVKVTNLRNGKSVIVRINDRGPFAKQRIIDLSKGAARHICMIGSGHAKVQLTQLASSAETGPAVRYEQLDELETITVPKRRPVGRFASWLRGDRTAGSGENDG